MADAAIGTVNTRELAVKRPFSAEVLAIVWNIGGRARSGGSITAIAAEFDKTSPRKASIGRPMRPALKRPDTVEGPATENGALSPVQLLTWQVGDVIECQTVPDIEYGVAAVKTRLGNICAVAI